MVYDEGRMPFIVILDRVTDVRNFGAIARTSYAAGVDAIVIPSRGSALINGDAMKTSAGALEFTRVARVPNLVSAIEELKKNNVWIVAADMDGDRSIYTHDFSGAVGIVVGSEGKGVSRLVKEKCDFVVHIPMKGQVNSLNASVAAALMIYEAARHRDTGR